MYSQTFQAIPSPCGDVVFQTIQTFQATPSPCGDVVFQTFQTIQTFQATPLPCGYVVFQTFQTIQTFQATPSPCGDVVFKTFQTIQTFQAIPSPCRDAVFQTFQIIQTFHATPSPCTDVAYPSKLSLPCGRLNWNGQATSTAYLTTASQSSSSVEKYVRANAGNVSNTVWGSLSRTLTLISEESRLTTTSDTISWHYLITKCAITADELWSIRAEKKQADRAAGTSSTNHADCFPPYGRGLFTRTGLTSHCRTHRVRSITNWSNVSVIFDNEGKKQMYIKAFSYRQH